MHFLFLAYLSFTLRTVCNKEYTRRFLKPKPIYFLMRLAYRSLA